MKSGFWAKILSELGDGLLTSSRLVGGWGYWRFVKFLPAQDHDFLWFKSEFSWFSRKWREIVKSRKVSCDYPSRFLLKMGGFRLIFGGIVPWDIARKISCALPLHCLLFFHGWMSIFTIFWWGILLGKDNLAVAGLCPFSYKASMLHCCAFLIWATLLCIADWLCAKFLRASL